MDLPELQMLFNVSINIWPSGNHLQHCWDSLGHSTWCTWNQVWRLVSFLSVISRRDGKPFLMVLMAVRRRDINLCCNFLKPEHAGARHWKSLWLWSQVGCWTQPSSSLTSSVVFPGSVQHLWLHSWIIPSQPRHCSDIYLSQGFETFYTRSCTPDKILLQIWDQLVWGEEQKACVREFWGKTCPTVKLPRRRHEILPCQHMLSREHLEDLLSAGAHRPSPVPQWTATAQESLQYLPKILIWSAGGDHNH